MFYNRGRFLIAIYAIGDLHLSLGGNKAMDTFPGWQGYVSRLERGWRKTVGEGDTVVLVGDTSWAVHPGELRPDFSFIHSLPGKKVLIKGNHDYWWSTKAKMQRFLLSEGFNSLNILHNDCYAVGDMAICGTRGWMLEEQTPHDQKLVMREAGRLEASLRAAAKAGKEPLVFLHYPPLFLEQMSGNMVELLLEYGVARCYYAHLHAAACKLAFNGRYMGIDFRLVSSDYLGFVPCFVGH